MLPIEKKLIKYNFTANANNPYYIVVHDTGNTTKGANALGHFNYFNGGDRQASAHVFVDDSNILQLIEFNDKAWHVGDGAGKYGITNGNSIGIEICINSDGNYDKAVTDTIELVVYLMRTYNIPLDRIVRHYDASRKNCPASMSSNSWAKWVEFKDKVNKLFNGGAPIKEVPKATTPKATIDDSVKALQHSLNVLKIRDGNGRALVEDGITGINTTNAVKTLQTILGLQADGVAGVNTLGAIKFIFDKPTISQGSKGVVVRYLQYRMITSVDGIFGAGTRSKVISFQKDNGLTTDGYVGAMTWGALFK